MQSDRDLFPKPLIINSQSKPQNTIAIISDILPDEAAALQNRQGVDIQRTAVIVPIVIDHTALADDDITDFAVDLAEWQGLVIRDFAVLVMEDESRAEQFFLEIVLILRDPAEKRVQIIAFSRKDIIQSQIGIIRADLNLMSIETIEKRAELFLGSRF